MLLARSRSGGDDMFAAAPSKSAAKIKAEAAAQRAREAAQAEAADQADETDPSLGAGSRPTLPPKRPPPSAGGESRRCTARIVAPGETEQIWTAPSEKG